MVEYCKILKMIISNTDISYSHTTQGKTRLLFRRVVSLIGGQVCVFTKLGAVLCLQFGVLLFHLT